MNSSDEDQSFSSTSDFYSSSDDSFSSIDDDESNEECFHEQYSVMSNGPVLLRQRRRNYNEIALSTNPNESDEENGRRLSSYIRRKRKKRLSIFALSWLLPRKLSQRFQEYSERQREVFLCRSSSCFLLISFLIWINIKAYYTSHPELPPWKFSPKDQRYASSIEERIKRREEEPSASWAKEMWARKQKKGSKEDIPEGCELQDWQKSSHPNCIEMHQLDLKLLLGYSIASKRFLQSSTLSIENGGKYLSSGLWRDVWSLPTGYNPDLLPLQQDQVVLKMMKPEHEVQLRNFERHRREAVVMDMLTASPRIVDLYSFCGNSLITEYLPMDLAKFLGTDDEHKKQKQETSHRTINSQQRLYLAKETAAALKDLHKYDVMHADLQSKQFLISASSSTFNGNSTKVKLNDFNRCRFLPRKVTSDNTTGPVCPIYIPSAPGSTRSPEEYELGELTTQIDVYSLANIWFEILTGEIPWKKVPTRNKIKTLVVAGQKPPLPDSWSSTNSNVSSLETSLEVLMSLAYNENPKERITARELVGEVERLKNTTLF